MIRLPILLTFLATLTFAQAQQPNIVFIISDDAGFADWTFMDDYTQSVNPGQANSPVPTPNLDRLRDRGVLLTNAYTAADITIFERMGARGYTTGAIGKWHVGGIPDIVAGGIPHIF